MDLFLSSLTCIAIIITGIFYWFKRINKYWQRQNVPSLPDPIPFFGHMLPIIKLQESTVSLAWKAYDSTSASMIGFYFMNRPGLVVRDPELVKSVLQTNFSNFRANITTLSVRNDPVLAKTPFFTDDNQLWKEQRIHTINHLSGKKLKSLFVIIREVCSKMSDFVERKVEEHGNVYECHLKELFVRCTGEVVANAALGIEGQSFDDYPDRLSFVKIAETVLKPKLVNTIKQTLIFIMPDFANFLRLKFLPDHSDAYFRHNLKSVIKKRREENFSPEDYLQFSLDSTAIDDIDAVISDVVGFYIDVYETTSSTLAHLFYYLSENQDVQEKLRSSIGEKLIDGQMTYESLKELNYLDQAINETLRLSPALAILMKRCTEGITLTGSDGLKCDLKPGNPIFVPVMGIHHDGQYWPDPEKFDPDRFNKENQENIRKFTFLGFGEGPRMCLGTRLGMMLTKMATISLIRKYSIEHSTRTQFPLKVEPTSLILYYKGGVWAKLKPLELE